MMAPDEGRMLYSQEHGNIAIDFPTKSGVKTNDLSNTHDDDVENA